MQPISRIRLTELERKMPVQNFSECSEMMLFKQLRSLSGLACLWQVSRNCIPYILKYNAVPKQEAVPEVFTTMEGTLLIEGSLWTNVL